MGDIPLDLLKTFIVYAASPNMRLAAEHLGMTQPTLSLQLTRLETFFQEPLFLHSGRRMILSRFGQSIQELVKPQIEALERSIGTLNREFKTQIPIRIGLRRESVERVIRKITFKTPIEFSLLPRASILRALENQELDLGIVRGKPDSSNLIARKFFQDSCLFILSKKLIPRGHLLIDLYRDPDFLNKIPFVAFNLYLPLIGDWFKSLQLNLKNMKPQVTIEDWLSLSLLVERGYGYSVIPKSVFFDSNQVESVPIENESIKPSDFFFVYHKDQRKSSIIQSLKLDTEPY